MVTKTFITAFLFGLPAGLFLMSSVKNNSPQSTTNNTTHSMISNKRDLISDTPNNTINKNHLYSSKNSLQDRLKKYSQYTPEEIENELFLINKNLLNYTSKTDEIHYLISIQYLAHKWVKTSPQKAMNFKKINGIHRLIFLFWHNRVYGHIWDRMVETGSASSEISNTKK